MRQIQLMGEASDFRDKQYAFARHIRDPENYPAPAGAEDRRMAIYRDLFLNNLRNLLSQTFPVLKKLHKPDKWRSIIRLFMAQHVAQTPYFVEIPREFLQFLQTEYVPAEDDFPFLVELAHYEWVELALSVSDATNDDVAFDPHGDMLDGVPVKSTLAWHFAYQYPVHRISTKFIPQAAGEQVSFLVIYRKANDDVAFMELNPVSARLLELIDANEDRTGRDLLVSLAGEIAYADVDALIQHGAAAMAEMQAAEILLGTKRSKKTN